MNNIEVNTHLETLTDAEIEAFKVFHPEYVIRDRNVIADLRSRINEAIHAQGLTRYKVGKSARVDLSNFYKYLKGTVNMDSEPLERIMGILGL